MQKSNPEIYLLEEEEEDGRRSCNCMFERDTHNDQGYHTHSSNYQNKSMPTERGLSVQ
jgi:hypothetical protein